MECSIRKKRTANARVVGATAKITWSKETKELVASYLNSNFQTYKSLADIGVSKIDFLRKMQKVLKLECSEQQLVNCFDNLIRKYKKVRDKLNVSRFGLLSQEKRFHKGWIMRNCSYFEILDEVFGERPNVVPPSTNQSSSFGGIGKLGSNSYYVIASGERSMGSLLDTESCNSLPGDKDNSNQVEVYNQSSGSNTSKSDEEKEAKVRVMHNLVRTTMAGLVVPGNKALTTFAPITTNIAETIKVVESGKLELEWEKFLFQKEFEERKQHQESEELTASLKLREIEHNFQLNKIKMEGDLQLQKLRLENQLQQLRSNNTSYNKHS